MKFLVFYNYLVELSITLLIFEIGQVIKSLRFLFLKEKWLMCHRADDMHIFVL